MPNISDERRVPFTTVYRKKFEVCPHCGQRVDPIEVARGYMTLPRLEAVRKAYGMSRYELASKIGTSASNIWRIEENGTMVNRDRAQRIADALGVEINELNAGG